MSILRDIDDSVCPTYHQEAGRQGDPRAGQTGTKESQCHHEHAQAGNLRRGQTSDEPGRRQSCHEGSDTGRGHGLTKSRLAQAQMSHDLRKAWNQVGESQTVGQEDQVDPGSGTQQLRTAPRPEAVDQRNGGAHQPRLSKSHEGGSTAMRKVDKGMASTTTGA